ncbi:MAG: hypothetical protein WBP85_10135 [Terracidiphilus sp.]
MQLFRRLVVLLALTCAGFASAFAQSSSSSVPDQSQSPDQANPTQANPDQATPAQETGGLTPGQLTVQERIRQRREQRRAAAIHETYDHHWDTSMDLGYLRFKPGASLQRLTWYAWNVGLTRYSTERLGFTLDARGYFGHAYCGTPGVTTYCEGNFTRPEISMYNVLLGPTYRFYVQPKYSISGRVMGGWALGNFSGDTNGFTTAEVGFYPDGSTYAASASIVGEYNLGPSLSFRLAPEYFFTGFGSTTQASRGFTIGAVYRFGKQ